MRAKVAIPAWIINGITISLVIVAAGLSFFAGRLSITWLPTATGRFSLLNQVYSLLEQQGLRAMPDEAALEYGAIRGLLQVYGDPYTIFIEPPQAEIQTNMLTGSYGGIGARLERDAQNKVLIYPYPNSPSALAGIKNADQLISVDQLIITSDTNLDEIIAALRGPIGDQISITVASQR